MQEKSIVHMDLDAFFVSVERLENSSLTGKPVLIGGSSSRGVVAACSYEARSFGIHSAMPMKMAIKLCPEAVLVKGDPERYSYYSHLVTDIIRYHVPVLEKASIDEFYIDMTGMDRFFSSYKLAGEIRQKIIKETGLPISLGFSSNKTVSKIATGEAKPCGQKRVNFGLEKPFLAPLSVKKIPMVGPKTYQTMRSLGLRYIQTIQEMPVELMEKAFGKAGQVIWKKANGIDNSPVITTYDRKSISSEKTFDKDTIDIHYLRNLISAMTEQLASKLRKEEKLTALVSVKIRYSNFETHSKQLKIPYTSADHILIPKMRELFERLYDKRMLVRLVGIRFSNLVHGAYQINLFDDSSEMIKLYQAIDRMNKKHGNRTVRRAVGMGIKYRGYISFSGETELND